MTPTAQTILITGGTEEARQHEALTIARTKIGTDNVEQCIDFVSFGIDEEKPTLGISRAREVKDWVKTKAVHQHKVAYIHNAHHLTREAQNALLKVLEEPPASSSIILSTTHYRTLLPTVVSRCLKQELNVPGIDTAALTASESDIIALIKSTLGERLDWREKQKKLPEDDTLHAVLNEWLVVVRDCAVYAATNDTAQLTLPNTEDTVATAALLPTHEWHATATHLTTALHHIATTKADRRSILDVMLLDLPQTQ